MPAPTPLVYMPTPSPLVYTPTESIIWESEYYSDQKTSDWLEIQIFQPKFSKNIAEFQWKTRRFTPVRSIFHPQNHWKSKDLHPSDEYFTHRIIENRKIYTRSIKNSPLRMIKNQYFPSNPVTVHPAWQRLFSSTFQSIWPTFQIFWQATFEDPSRSYRPIHTDWWEIQTIFKENLHFTVYFLSFPIST